MLHLQWIAIGMHKGSNLSLFGSTAACVLCFCRAELSRYCEISADNGFVRVARRAMRDESGAGRYDAIARGKRLAESDRELKFDDRRAAAGRALISGVVAARK